MLYDDDDYFHNINNSNNKRKNACGDGYCLNGGNCVTEQITMQDGISDMKEYCDCSQAYDASSKYAGLFCQYKSTSLCQVENSLKDSLDSAFCVHNGICQEDGSCGCLSGWTGQHCELKSLDLGGNSASQVLPDIDSGDTYIEVDECGDTTCYNGGICVKTKRQQSNGDFLVETHCDCSTAFDEKYLYAGLSCEFPSTELCSVPLGGQDLSGSSFCTNHGICRDKSELGCDCAPGFFGSACEYEDETFDQMEKDDDDDDWEVCGPGICHHGGTCITSIIYSEETDTSETRYSCDCSTAYDNEAAYLGTSCEYPSTTICTPPKSGESLSSARFCVNHGTCSQDSFNDCDCRDGFEGRFCQFKMGLGQIDDDKDDDDGYDQEFELCGDNLICFNVSKVIPCHEKATYLMWTDSTFVCPVKLKYRVVNVLQQSILMRMARPSKSEHATVIQPRMESTSLQVLPVNTWRLPSVLFLQKLHFVSMEGNVRKVMFVIVSCRGKAIAVNSLLTRRIRIAIIPRVAATVRMITIR